MDNIKSVKAIALCFLIGIASSVVAGPKKNVVCKKKKQIRVLLKNSKTSKRSNRPSGCAHNSRFCCCCRKSKRINFYMSKGIHPWAALIV